MITSTSNPQIKSLLQLQKKGKLRNAQGVFLVEGYRMFCEVPKERLQKTYVSETFYEKRSEELKAIDTPIEILADHVFSYVSDTKTPQGILCVVTQAHYVLENLLTAEKPFFLILDNLQDPGNMGTIIRTAEGAGVNGVLMSSDCVDIYNPKTIRSTMGSIYRMPIIYCEDMAEMAKRLKANEVQLYAAHLDGKHTYDQEDYSKGTAFLIGNEGNGLRDEIAALADAYIRIPMQGEVESLNAAIAASILMFEACRQRR